jgi:enamine deaminase RidA (YjgF/YER057c/UK114 family)
MPRDSIRAVPLSSPSFSSPDDLSTPSGFSQVVRIPSGGLVWTSGQVAVDPDGNVVTPGSWEDQTRTAFANVGRALQAGGADWPDVVKFTFFVVDVSELATVQAIREEFIDVARAPTSTLVQVSALVRPELLIEIEAVAHVA